VLFMNETNFFFRAVCYGCWLAAWPLAVVAALASTHWYGWFASGTWAVLFLALYAAFLLLLQLAIIIPWVARFLENVYDVVSLIWGLVGEGVNPLNS